MKEREFKNENRQKQKNEKIVPHSFLKLLVKGKLADFYKLILIKYTTNIFHWHI